MIDRFNKFPSTPHLALLGGVGVRDDKVMSEFERCEFLRHELVVEEKVDGANLGISFDESKKEVHICNFHIWDSGKNFHRGWLQKPTGFLNN